ncbi:MULTISPECIES: citrate lyase holo-[acyl-carrier protein] synthase [unclassified Oceanispirochaeta]|uniref:citrate lyase holo-[acyl-carrier protein] synthase n=1 Tax=unclassified Oceanispirochaeta TaxID=2635722 RepID=UPI000E099166|nr:MULTISPECIES: citrate lyase holo-[acyl-carrier protein] synthase [unclassified Oceanispirochaeta]MBF9015322.1 citrate lyase holo-[acyl-carrier protein] synthase [Oceanispirochaeta sp. M2]NPD71780.1 citrate lyase holo-[acyl-carrier protein] synthase [Oceanispirochaeta sp. M1]RDG32970.1 citrate lyase holo-[acyl-carrier protein] synthase [Oceanispirochaeta sp. M1]
MNYSPVTLTEMLDAREMRSHHRQKLICLHKSALIQLSINSPGSEKNSSVITEIFSEGLRSILKKFDESIIEYNSETQSNTGPQAFIAIALPARKIKMKTSSIELSHPLGRLWDIDVYDVDKRLLSRKELGLPERLCYICREPAHVCSRSQRHTQEDLKAFILDIYQSYSDRIRIS